MKYDWPTDEEGEAAIAALKESMPSERQTEYKRRDIEKRRERMKKNRKIKL